MLNPNAYLFTQQTAAPEFAPIKNPNPGAWYNPYLELDQGYYQPDSEVKEDAPTEEVKAAVEEEDNSLKNEPVPVDPNAISLGGLNRLQGLLGKGLSNTELGIAGAIGLGPLAAIMKGKGLYDAYQGLDAYAKRVGDTRLGAISRLNNSNAKIKGNVLYDNDTSNDNQHGFTGKDTYVDSSGNIRDTSNLSAAAKKGLAIASSESESDRYTSGGTPLDEVIGTTNYEAANQDFNNDGVVSDDFYGDNKGRLITMNSGGMPMRNSLISYRQVGGPVPEAPPQPPLGVSNEPTAPVPPAPAAPQTPATPPQMPTPPSPTPRKSFAEKVAEAKAALRGEMGLNVAPEAPQMAPADGQGDSGIIDPAGVFEPSQGELGPDMAFDNGMGGTGLDNIDGHLPEGSMVMNPEASEMFSEELKAMARGGYV